MKYTKKPVEIDAWKLDFNYHCIDALLEIMGGKSRRGIDGSILIQTLEGEMRAVTGDYIIKGVKGEFYPCKPDIFELTYDKI